MTSDIFNATLLGSCSYTCPSCAQWFPDERELNYHQCAKTWKRTGRLCAQCIDGHGPPVYSYSMQCIPCSPEVVRDSIVWFLVSFLPLTVFCLTIITLRISVARPPMSTFILVSQVMSAPQYLAFFLRPHTASKLVTHSFHEYSWKSFATFYGFWNLDIFRSFYPQMCLSQNMSTLQAHFLEYAIALFPLAILMLIVLSVRFYNRGNRAIFFICRPIHSCLARFRRTIDTRNSLIDAFATFIILSLSKIGYTSFDILQPVKVFSPNGNHSLFVYIDPTLRYFGREHLPYALTALVLSFVLILIPLLLLFLYPLRSFQTFLNNRQWQCTTLHIFADSFQGCYKDGTNGTRDYRWFAGLHLLLRFAIVVPFQLAKYHQLTLIIMLISLSFYMVLLSVFQPYKKHAHLVQDVILLFGLLLWNTAVLVGLLDIYGRDQDVHDLQVHLTMLVLGSLIPIMYIIGLVIYWLAAVRKLHIRIVTTVRQRFCSGGRMRLLLVDTGN